MTEKSLKASYGQHQHDSNREYILEKLGEVRMQREHSNLSVPLESGIINLHGWRVLHQVDRADKIIVYALYHYDGDLACPKCGAFNDSVKHDSRKREFTDLPVHGKQVFIRTKQKRYRCKSCKHMFSAPLFHMHDSRLMTKRLVQYVERCSLPETFTAVANRVGIDEKTVRLIFTDNVTRLEAERELRTPTWLGIDELKLRGEFRCMVVDIKRRQPIELLVNRDQPTVEMLLTQFDLSSIEYAVMDMWKPYRLAVKRLLPNIPIVVDRFHINRMANDAMETVRRGLRDGLGKNRKRELLHMRRFLLKRSFQLKPEQEFLRDAWFSEYTKLSEAYWAKERFLDIWNAGDSGTARIKYSEWLDKLPASVRPAYRKTTTSMKNWRDPIFAYFDLRLTNAYTEAMNGILKMLNRAGRGYTYPVVRAKLVHGFYRADIDPDEIPTVYSISGYPDDPEST